MAHDDRHTAIEEGGVTARSAAASAPAGRTFAKALSWQALGLVTSTATAFALTGSLALGGTFALVSAVLGTVLFVVHERVWARFDRAEDRA